MKICKIWDSDYPWDVRVEKICNSLVASGHEVHLVCRNKKRNNVYEFYQGFYIHRLPKIGRLFNEIASFPFFLNPIWIYAVVRVVWRYKIEAILVRDLPMALAGIFVGWLKNIPCFLDMAEPYPEMLEGYKKLQKISIGRKIINFFVRNSAFAFIVEKLTCHFISHIFSVSEEIKKNLIRKGVQEKKIELFYNTPKNKKINDINDEDILRKNSDNEISIMYVGDLTEARGLPIVIHAIERLNKQGEFYRFVIIGKGRFETELVRIVNEKKMEKTIIFKGWISNDKLLRHLCYGDIGIIPHLKTLHNDLTIPNKVFDYMASGLPIISANLRPIKRIIEEAKCGLIFDDYNVESLTDKLLILKNKELRRKLGNNGRRAVKSKYNWDIDFQNFIKTVYRYL